MYVTIDTVLKWLALISSAAAAIALGWKLFQWINHQKEQDEEIKKIKARQDKDRLDMTTAMNDQVRKLEEKHDREMAAMSAKNEKATNSIQEEQTLIMYGMLACLQGLDGMGCGGPIPQTIDKINKYLNQKAHDQK